MLYTKQIGQKRAIFRKERWTGEVTSFASDKHTSDEHAELVDTPGHTKPVNFGHMTSRGQEAYPLKSQTEEIGQNDSKG